MENALPGDIREKTVAQARRIMALAVATANTERRAGKSWKDFQMTAIGHGLHAAAIYHHITSRTTGYDIAKNKVGDLDDQNIVSQLQGSIDKTVSACQAIAGADYQKGSGWHHWVVNGDRDRSVAGGTPKQYIPLDYRSFIAAGPGAIAAALRNLAHNQYRGQFKLIADAKGFISREDNICIHSDVRNAKMGTQIVLAVLKRDGVRVGGGHSNELATSGLDFGGSSFNDSISQMAQTFLVKLLNGCNDYDHFIRNVTNAFSQNGSFLQWVIPALEKSMPQAAG